MVFKESRRNKERFNRKVGDDYKRNNYRHRFTLSAFKW